MKTKRSVAKTSFSVPKRAKLWQPEVTLQGGKKYRTRKPKAGDWYAVVDELDDDVAVLELAKWPRLDAGGRPRFKIVTERTCARSGLREALTRARKKLKQKAPDREVRIGDTFWIQGPKRPSKDPGTWSCVDITEAARMLAKMAMYGAVASISEDRKSYLQIQQRKGPEALRRPRNPTAVAEPEV